MGEDFRQDTGTADRVVTYLAGRDLYVAGHDQHIHGDHGTGQAGPDEIVVYLRTLIEWLSSDPWPRDPRFGGSALSPAAIESKMRISVWAGAPRRRYFSNRYNWSNEYDADWLAEECERLVILGDPGTGKTWLARRIARRAAEAALAALAGGAGLDHVELPLFTTCSRLASEPGGIRGAAISSALDQLGDLGGSRVSGPVRALFADRNAPTILVIDSLDEAGDADERLRQADSLPWRVILTSRPGSWNGQLAVNSHDDSRCVGELLPLHYPHDVEPVIARWFGGAPAGDRLAAQIAGSASLQETARIPLLLAFYCLVGADASLLPASRRQLYAKVIRRLLTSRWRGQGDVRQPDIARCLQVLKAWAGAGAGTSTASETGAWPDAVVTAPSGLSRADDIALDCVAAPSGPADVDSGMTVRRFIHRTVREHLVAEHVAGLPLRQAAETLLPHLWYDQAWRYSAAMAIAAHPQRDQLLRVLLRSAGASTLPASPASFDVGWEIRGLLARVANESSQADWSLPVAAVIRQARLQLAEAARPGDLDGTPGWTSSARQERETLLAHLAALSSRTQWPSTDPSAEELAGAATRLALTARDRSQVREALLRLLEGRPENELGFTRAPWSRESPLAQGIVRLCLAEDDKDLARSVLLRALAAPAYGQAAPEFVDGLTWLARTEDDKRQARHALLELMARETRPQVAAALAGGLAGLDVAAADQPDVIDLLLRLLRQIVHGPPRGAKEIVDAVVLSASSPGRKRLACEALLTMLADMIQSSDGSPEAGEISGETAAALTSGVVGLAPTEADRQKARRLLLEIMARHPVQARVIAALFAGLKPTRTERRRVRQILARDMSEDPNWQSWSRPQIYYSDTDKEDRVGAMIALCLDPDEKDEALDVLLGQLGRYLSSNQRIERVDEGIVLLARATARIRPVRHTLLELLDGSSLRDAGLVADMITQLDPSPAESLQVCELLLHRIVPGEWATYHIDTLVKLAVTTESRLSVTTALLDLLAGQDANSWGEDQLVKGITDLTHNTSAAQPTRERLLALLQVAAGTEVPGTHDRAFLAAALAECISRLRPPARQQRHACRILLGLLRSTTDGHPSHRGPYSAIRLARTIAHLNPTQEESRQVREHLLLWITAETTTGRPGNPPTCDRDVSDLTEALLQFAPTRRDKAQARSRILSCLAREGDNTHAQWEIERMLSLNPAARDLRGTGIWEHSPSAVLLTEIRKNTPLQDWIAELPTLAAISRQPDWHWRIPLLQP